MNIMIFAIIFEIFKSFFQMFIIKLCNVFSNFVLGH